MFKYTEQNTCLSLWERWHEVTERAKHPPMQNAKLLILLFCKYCVNKLRFFVFVADFLHKKPFSALYVGGVFLGKKKNNIKEVLL